MIGFEWSKYLELIEKLKEATNDQLFLEDLREIAEGCELSVRWRNFGIDG